MTLELNTKLEKTVKSPAMPEKQNRWNIKNSFNQLKNTFEINT